jgi:hypothetical protein
MFLFQSSFFEAFLLQSKQAHLAGSHCYRHFPTCTVSTDKQEDGDKNGKDGRMGSCCLSRVSVCVVEHPCI